MKKEQKSLRATLLLYLAVLLLPLGTLYNYKLYQDLQDTAYAINQIMKVPEGLLLIVSTVSNEQQHKQVKNIDADLKKTGEWIARHDTDKDYVGAGRLSRQYNNVYKCWKEIYTDHTKIKMIEDECLKFVHSLIFSLERMYILKQKRFEQSLLIIGAIIIALLLLAIYLIRLYLYHQAKEHAIFDFETKLYNQVFLEEAYRNQCAKVRRYNKILSVTNIEIPQLHSSNGALSKEERREILHQTGELFWNITRDSDLAFHTENENFVLIMPETTAEESTVVEERLKNIFYEKFGDKITLTCISCEVSDENSCETVFKSCIKP